MTSYNKFASIQIGGTYTNTISKTYNQASVNVSFDCSGNLLTNSNSYLQGDLYLGYEYQDPSGNYIDSGGSIIIKLNNVTYTISPLELSYLDGITSNVQTQLNSISGVSLSGNNTFTGLNTFSNVTYHNNNTVFFENLDNTKYWYINSDSTALMGHWTGSGSNIVFSGSTGTGVFSGLLSCNGGLTLIAGQNLNLNGNIIANSLTISPTELGYLDGVTSNIQTQINSIVSGGSVSLSGTNAFTGSNSFAGVTTFTNNIIANSLTISPTELGYLDGVTSNIQTQLNSIGGGGASLSGNNTFTGSNNFSSQVFLTDTGNSLSIYGSLGLISVLDSVTQSELYALKSISSNIQTQLNSKAGLTAINSYSNTQNFNYQTNFITGQQCTMNSTFALNGNLQLDTISITKAELKYLDGMTSNIQTQINNSVSNTANNTLSGINSFTNVVNFKGDDIYFGLATSGSDFTFHSARSNANINLFPDTTGFINIGDTTNYPLIRIQDSFYIYRSLNITGGTTLTIPLYQTYIIKTSSNITITLPLVTSQHIGLIITFRCIQSVSQNITINTNASNYLIEEGSVTEVQSTLTAIGGKKTSCSFVICQLVSGNYGWALFSNAGTLFRGDVTITSGNNITINGTSKIIMDSGALVQTNGTQISDVELSYLDTVSSNIQSQLDAKAGLGSNTFTGITSFTNDIYVNTLNISPTELSYLDTVSSNIQTQLNAKATDTAVCHNTGTETWSGIKTFSSIPQLSTVGTLDNDIINFKTMRSLYAGVFCVTLQGSTHIRTPILYSVTNLNTNIYKQTTTTGALTTAQSGTVAGNWNAGSPLNQKDTCWLVYPNFGLIVYTTTGWTGTISVNFKNTTTRPVFVAAATLLTCQSIKVYFQDVEIT